MNIKPGRKVYGVTAFIAIYPLKLETASFLLLIRNKLDVLCMMQ